MGALLFLVGPKGLGKSWVAEIAERDFGVRHLDADALILDLLAEGVFSHPEDGWLEPVEQAVLDTLSERNAVSTEATGAWDSDYKLAQHVEQHGHRALRVWVSAPIEETIARLLARTTRRVAVTGEGRDRVTRRPIFGGLIKGYRNAA